MNTRLKFSLSSLLFPVLAAGLFLSGFAAQRSERDRSERDREQHQERFAKTVPLAREGAFSLSNIAGDIQVETWNRAEVQIEAIKTSRASTLELAQENAQLVEIVVEAVDNEVRVETQYPKNHNRNLNVSVEYVVMIPDRAAANVTSVSGTIRAAGVGGKAHLKTVSGDVDGQRLQGPTEAKSVSGEVTVGDTLDSVICESVSGSVRAINVGGETRIKSVSGDVTVENSRGAVDAEALSGNVQIAEGANTGFDLRASTFSGRIKTDFALEADASDDEGKNVRGSVNGGGKSIRAKSFSGDVRLTRQ